MLDTKTLIEKIQSELDSIRTFFINEGADVRFVDYKDGILTLEISNSCSTLCPGCLGFEARYGWGIKENFKQAHPEEIKEVVLVSKKAVN